VSDDAGSDDAVSDQAGNGEAGNGGPTPEERRALFRVVRGKPTDAELAALTVVLAAVATTPVRRPLAAGPGAWRTSFWPR